MLDFLIHKSKDVDDENAVIIIHDHINDVSHNLYKKKKSLFSVWKEVIQNLVMMII
jgi:hypothetical protein